MTQTNRLFVGGLSFSASREDLIKHFSAAGKVVSVFVPQDPNAKNRNRGFAFVEMLEGSMAEKALEMFDQQEGPNNRKISVRYAESSKRD